MRHRLRTLWPLVKFVLGLTIVVLVGRQFARDLQRPELWQRPLQFGWVILTGCLYPAGLCFSAWYWQRLMRRLGERPNTSVTLRAYFVGQLGKYVPGKAWALLLRAGFAQEGGARFGVAFLTSFYESLATMASGALVATVLFTVLLPNSLISWNWETIQRLLSSSPTDGAPQEVPYALLALVLLVMMLVPLAPPVFNRILQRLPSRPPGGSEAPDKLPALRFAWLLEGLVIVALGWLTLGASLALLLHGILGDTLTWTGRLFAIITAELALSYVGSFVILVAPAGLGVREFLLTMFLAPELERAAALTPEDARSVAVLAVLLLRLAWTTAELLVAGILYCRRAGDMHPRIDST